MNNPFDLIARMGIIPVIAIDDAKHAQPLAEALLEGGIGCIEITFRTSAARASIEIIAKKCPDLLVGAGTILDIPSLCAARDAGATFGLSPGYAPHIVQAAQALQFAFAPGVMTPSEVGACLSSGIKDMKFFPAGAAGGTKMLLSIAAPFAHLEPRFIPTGGVSQANLQEWLSIPSVLSVGGTWIATQEKIASQSWSEITALSRAALLAIEEIRKS